MAASSSTSTSLLQRVRLQDNEAWKRLVDVYGPLVYRWCRNNFRLQPADAEEVAADTLAAVAAGLDRFEREVDGAFHRWLWVIAKRKVIDQGRRRRRQPSVVGGSDWQAIVSEVQEQEFDEAEMSEATTWVYQQVVDTIRSEFSERDWEIFQEVKVVGKSPREVAEAMGVSRAVVYNATCRIPRRIREELEGLL